MLKIKKGIKKKIKGKKDKGKEDLFDPEQLAKFKKELEEQGRKSPVPGDTSDADHTHAPNESHADHEQDEEWLKFKQLTSGVDDILKKTTGDLDRIKSSSYFQRTSKANEQFASERPSSSAQAQVADEVAQSSSSLKKDPRWIGFEGKRREEHESDSEQEAVHQDEAFGNVAETEAEPESVLKEFEIPEEDPTLDDSLFDTTFVDAVASGEIKLAYIPESPTKEPDEEDPFDTSAVADVVKKIEEDEKKRKKQVNLGVAVDFLTNKTDKVEKVPVGIDGKKKPRPRPHNVNLIGSFDEDSLPTAVASDAPVERAKDLFDEILDSPPKDTSSSLLDEVDNFVLKTTAPPQQHKESEKDDRSQLKDLLSEFDVISDVTVDEGLLSLKLGPEPEEEVDEDDEFALLAAESLHKEVTPVNLGKKAPPKPPPPSAAHLSPASTKTEEEDQETVEDDEEDPFDTTFVEKIQPGKGELKIIETELLGVTQETSATEEFGDDDDFDFNPRLGEENIPVTQVSPLPVTQTDLLDTTEGEHSVVRAAVIQPVSELVPIESDRDPFDTSSVETVLPGKAELKLLEEELSNVEEQLPGIVLSAAATAIINTPAVTDPFDDDFADFDPRAGEVKPEPLHPLDLLHEESLSDKVLTPVTDVAEEIDPFDTSIVTDNILPGKVELRLLESELISAAPIIPFTPSPIPNSEQVIDIEPPTLHRQISDPDFDPRGGEEAPVLIETDNTPRDVFESHEVLTCEKPLTPSLGEKQYVPQEAEDFVDPFDTSAIEVDGINKVDLKLLEGELLNSTVDVAPARPLPQFIVAAEPIKPVTPSPAVSPAPVPHLFETDHLTDDGIELAKPLTPSEVDELGRKSVFEDPFDTSIVDSKAVPGKTELKILEEELDVEPGIKRSVTDPDFNPRESIHPSVDLSCQPLVPQVQGENASFEVYEDDPFDTSHAEALIPGKAELKILEAELL